MQRRTAIVTGGLRGLGLAMVRGLAETGWAVVAVGHIADDLPTFRDLFSTEAAAEPLVADLRDPAECDRAIASARDWFGSVDVLVNNAALTYTFSDPDRFSRGYPLPFWEIPDAVSRSVIETNYLVAEQMARRAAICMQSVGWGRIVNVTTNVATMGEPGATPYGPSKAALELATEVWATELSGSGITVNVLNPGFGADTPGMSEVLRERSRRGDFPPLLKPEAMVPPLLWLVSPAADPVSGWRFDANTWDTTLPAHDAAFRAGRPVGLTLHDKPAQWPFAPG